MPLTTVSNAWREDGREAWLSSQRKPNRGRPALGQARVTGQSKDQGAEGHEQHLCAGQYLPAKRLVGMRHAQMSFCLVPKILSPASPRPGTM